MEFTAIFTYCFILSIKFFWAGQFFFINGVENIYLKIVYTFSDDHYPPPPPPTPVLQNTNILRPLHIRKLWAQLYTIKKLYKEGEIL